MKTKFALLAFAIAPVLFQTSLAHAFDITGYGGINLTNNAFTGPAGSGERGGSTFAYGALLSSQALEIFELEYGLLYMPRAVTYSVLGLADDTQSYSTVVLPVSLRIKLPLLSAGLGFYYGFAFGNVGHSNGVGANSLSAAGYNSSDYGLTGDLRLSLPVAPTLSAVLDLRYLFGLTNTSSASGISTSTRDVAILAGLSFGL